MTLTLVIASAWLAAAQERPQSCPDPGSGQRRTYRNERFGFAMNYPSMFRLDPESVPEASDSARFWTANRAATAVVNGSRNPRNQSLAQLMEEAERDVLLNSRGEITYRRRRDNWFVISGHMVGRIFYQRTLLTRDGRIATLWIEFPRDMKSCFEDAVTMMSLSLREQ
jgi:hypothetical protein